MVSNQTTVSVGVLAGTLVTFIVTILNTYVGIEPPISGELAAGATAIITMVTQLFFPRNVS